MNGRIKKLRKELDLTQQEFADKIGVKRNTIATYEIGRNVPLDAVIVLICREFNVSETWLRTGEGEMFIPKKEGALDELAKQRGLTRGDCILIEKFLELKPGSRQAVMEYMKKVVAALSNDGPAAPAFAPAYVPTIEEEARAEANQQAQLLYQQILSEKRAAAGMPPGSSGPLAGGGTAKQA